MPKRVPLDYRQHELEAESVAYLVCRWNGVNRIDLAILLGAWG